MKYKQIYPSKIVICGHWNCSYGNDIYHNNSEGQYNKESNFEPFIDEGIIAIDACTAVSGKINMLTLDID